MEVLILSCSTGGGHNSAGLAIKDEMENRGHNVVMFDPYELVGNDLDKKIGNAYISLVRYAPYAFGCLYKLGEWYSRLPIKSPVYLANEQMEKPLEKYFENHHFDIIFMTHIFPGQMISHLKAKGVHIPKTIYIATDYTCIPFTEEVDADYYIIPNKNITDVFTSKGIDENKIRPMGIPVRRAFLNPIKTDILKSEDKFSILLSSGSIGVNKMFTVVKMLREYLETNKNTELTVICGENRLLFRRLSELYAGFDRIKLIQKTPYMADYMRACDVFICKPGGLSSTEAAVIGMPFIQVLAIPGCESANIKFFDKYGMSFGVGNKLRRLPEVLKYIQDNPSCADKIAEAQHREINANAASDICDFASSIINK